MLTISKITADAHEEAARLLAKTMASNPINKAVFKSVLSLAVARECPLYLFCDKASGPLTF